MKLIDIFKLILRTLAGLFFIVTAILKLISIDAFELYVYSFGIFNYFIVTILVRLIIACEMVIGVFLIAKIKYKYTWWITMLMMIGFTFLLIYAAIFRNDSNCHCFGELVQVDPIHSILKNVILIVVLILIYKEKECTFKLKKWVEVLTIAVALIVNFIVITPDQIYNRVFSPQGEVNLQAFNVLKTDTIVKDFNIDSGRYILSFYIPGCKFCKLSVKKLEAIISNNNINTDHIKIMMAYVSSPQFDSTITLFKTESNTTGYPYYYLPPLLSIQIINGSFPTFVFTQDGAIVKSVDLRGLTEEEVVSFLEK
ncbi:MAG: hypothetical protein LBU51_03625 [Bacteroidales bacterium]|jgi:hypothetical protein|nr:hypothetical protein [Bacteroidales bacterium]